MPWFLTEYRVRSPAGIARYGAHLWARGWDAARRIARRRRMGERVLGICQHRRRSPDPVPSQLLRKRKLTKAQALEIAHGLVFLGYAALRSRAATVAEVLGDQGAVHEALHSISFGRPRRRDVIQAVEQLEAHVPGFRGPTPRHHRRTVPPPGVVMERWAVERKRARSRQKRSR